MKIAVNTRLLQKGKLEGIGWFTFEVLKRITQQHPEHHFYFLFDRPFSSDFIFADNITPVVLFPQARHPILFNIWFNWSVSKFLKKNKIDVLFSPDGYLSLRTKVPQIATIHDLNFEHYPEFLPAHILRYYKKKFPLFAKYSHRVLTVSEFSKQDIHKLYNIPLSKIDVAYNGINPVFSPLSTSEQQIVRKSITNGKPYFIYIGSLNKRKNISNMLKAFDLFKSNNGHSNHKFLLVGENMFTGQDYNKVYQSMRHKDDVVFLGRLYDDQLKGILSSATALLYVSYFEGFGIPIVEAMKSGVPVITGTNSAMPEIGGEAALYCEPNDIQQIAKTMNEITKPEVREKVIKKGLERAKQFNWDITADRVWKTIDKVLSELE